MFLTATAARAPITRTGYKPQPSESKKTRAPWRVYRPQSMPKVLQTKKTVIQLALLTPEQKQRQQQLVEAVRAHAREHPKARGGGLKRSFLNEHEKLVPEDQRYSEKDVDAAVKIYVDQEKKQEHKKVASGQGVPSGLGELLRAACREHKDSSMVCVMFDSVKGTYTTGHSKHGQAQGLVPDRIWNSIPNERIPEMSYFSKNCAEVEALIKAYNSRKKGSEEDLRGCVFYAMRVRDQTMAGPCQSCRSWITRHHGKAPQPSM